MNSTYEISKLKVFHDNTYISTFKCFDSKCLLSKMLKHYDLVNILQFSMFIAREWLIIKGFLYENDDYHIISNANGVIKYSCDNFFCMYTKRVSNKIWNVMPIYRVIFMEDHILIRPDRSLLLGKYTSKWSLWDVVFHEKTDFDEMRLYFYS